MKRFAVFFSLVGLGALFFLSACKSTLAPGGAYAPTVITTNAAGQLVTNQVVMADMAFYVTDSAFLMSASALDVAFRFERDNRAALWQLDPNIKHTLDRIRPDALAAVTTYKAARGAYKSSPTPTGLSLLNTILAKVQQFATTASAAVTNLTSSGNTFIKSTP